MTAPTEDLIKRLEGEARSWESTRAEDFTPLPFEPLLTEAAQALRSLQEEVERLRGALLVADQFVTNGIALGFIRMPEEGTPDPALLTPGIIRSALNTGSGEG